MEAIFNIPYIKPIKGYVNKTDKNVSSIDLTSLFQDGKMIGVGVLFTPDDENGVFTFTDNGLLRMRNKESEDGYRFKEFGVGPAKTLGSIGVHYEWIHHMDLYLKTLLKKTGPSEWARYENVMNKYPLVGLAAAFGVRLQAMEKISKLIEKQEQTAEEDDFDMSKMTKTNKLAAMDFRPTGGRSKPKRGRSRG